jgi:RNA polymerase sigma-70 factor (ECF subfamily)
MDEKDIIKKIQEGQIDLFEYFVHEYASKMFFYIHQRVSNEADAKDILQNSFVKAYKAIDTFDTNKKFYPFFFTIVKNEISEFFRKNKKSVSLDEAVDMIHIHESENTPMQILPLLKREYGKVLKWYGEGFSYKEIANKMNKPINTVKTLIRRAKKQFIEEYDKQK